MADATPEADDIDPRVIAMLLAAEAAHDGGDPDAAHKIAALADDDDEGQDPTDVDDNATDLHDPSTDY